MRLLKALAVAAVIIATSIPGMASGAWKADLSVSVVGSPNPVVGSKDITWTINVTNLGPGQATGVQLEVFYGSDASALSATTTQGTCSDISRDRRLLPGHHCPWGAGHRHLRHADLSGEMATPWT